MEDLFKRLTVADPNNNAVSMVEVSIETTTSMIDGEMQDTEIIECFRYSTENFKLRRFTESLQHLEKVILKDSGNAKGHNAKGCALHEIGM